MRRRTARALVAALAALAAVPVLAAMADAQSPRRGDRVTVRSGTALRGTPGGDVIGVSSREISATVESAQSTFVRITISGHVEPAAIRLTADRTRGEVSEARGTTLHASASRASASVAELRRGTYVFPDGAASFPSSRGADFFSARRSLWVDVSRLAARTTAAAPSRAAAAQGSQTSQAAQATPSASDAGRERGTTAEGAPERAPVPAGPTLETRVQTSLQAGPGGEVLASVPGGVALTTLAREGGWVRVRIEGWMPDSAVEAAGTRSAGALTAADLRANPEGTKGRLVRWSVESLAFQTADELRRGLTAGEPYLLARGPGNERAVLYLAVPDSLVGRAQALPPLAEISITARVRVGRSEPAGVPILDLIDLARR